ncbi:hypothetical protein H0H92_011781 [Tricholoma furcatifolium]|nr:hypothetical protein H0H92_011781 [Tricholoma furcatifolium]
MDSTLLTLPEISISPAPPQEPVVEPYSPFLATPSPVDDDDAFRSVHLTPPPTLTKFSKCAKPLSPLRPSDDASLTPGKGLERERFEALLQASRERNVALGSRKACDLRKEITMKAHRNKQVLAPPSPTATLTPKTPPDSPAIFHYSLPSPGLESPLALFESLSADSDSPLPYGREPRIEKVDFRVPEYTKAKEPTPRGRSLPSLDQITARLTSNVRQRNDTVSPVDLRPAAVTDRPRLQLGVGRLTMPIRTLPPDSHKAAPELLDANPPAHPILAMPSVISSRERKAHDMLSTLRRRTSLFEPRLDGVQQHGDVRGAKWKRHSAPADLLPLHTRLGFEHPVLALPGGF